MLYKMDLLCLDKEIFSVVNIRLNLERFSLRKSQRKIVKKVEDRFRVTISHAFPNEQKELLYQQQKHKFQGFIHPTLSDYLNSSLPSSVFDTREVCVYDDEKLIAVSFFDLGEKSMASLLCLYDPCYSPFSLGVYTMLKEVEFGIRKGMKWYYPGYVLDSDSGFNYKLRLGDYEYYNSNKRWANFENFDSEESVGRIFKRKMARLEDIFKEFGVEYRYTLYPFFSMGYVGFWSVEFVKFPGFYELPTDDNEIKLIVSFDLDNDVFVVSKAIYASNYDHLVNMEVSEDFAKSDKYLMRLLMISEDLAVENDAVSIVGWLTQKQMIKIDN